MTCHFPDNIMAALKTAVVSVFWRKKDFRQLLDRCCVPQALYAQCDWQAAKYHIVDPVINSLNTMADGIGPLRRLLAETLTYTDGDHLLCFNDGKRLKREAERALEHLRLLVKEHDTELKSVQQEQAKRRQEYEATRSKAAFAQKLAGIRDGFATMVAAHDPQQRGRDLEAILRELFALFDLDPRGAFSVRGEQIDGAFSLDGDSFLLEAKWQDAPVNLEQLRDLDGAVTANLDNTLGLFLSVSGFSQAALDRYTQGSRPRLICMDGQDLMYVLEGRIDLPDLLNRKRAVAAQKGTIFTPVTAILAGDV